MHGHIHGHIHQSIKTHVFLTGATGYIGGSVLARLLSHPLSDTFRFTILVRKAENVSQFRSMGIRAVLGSNSDLGLLRELAADADLVVACADVDDEDAARAILQGLKDRFEKTGKVPSLIHTSGTGVLIDDARGMFSTDTIYSDLDISQLESLPVTQPHRSVDLTVVNADKEGYVKTYIILPSTIYGIASGPLVDAGLQNSHSQQIPRLVELSLDRGQAGMVGEGKNIWPNVHIHEVADLYIHIVDLIIPHSADIHGHRSRTPTPHTHFEHGASGFYFCENGEHTLRAVGEAIGKVMVALGKAKDATPIPFTDEELQKYFPDGTSLGSNSRCRADRAKSIGWKPKKTTKDLLASIKYEFKPIELEE
ncbi:NAD-P-binding protein [Flammula alnicola]|nr:NAD-P-binding protein [Flammula alnicola]